MSRRDFSDVPLPGLEFDHWPSPDVDRPAQRAYSAQLPPTDAAIAHFWARVVRTPDCLLWVGSISGGDGYGRITWRRDGVSRTMSAHRFALLLAHGDDVSSSVGEHRCNEPLCVRVDDEHLIPSTQTANLLYAVACGRAGAHRTPGDGRTRAQRSLAVRDAVANGWDPIAYARAAGHTAPLDAPPLF